MHKLLISQDFEGGMFPEKVSVKGRELFLEKGDASNHFYFHFRVANPSSEPCTVRAACRWACTADQKFGLFPEVNRGGGWERVEVLGYGGEDGIEMAEGSFSFDLGSGEETVLANTPCMNTTDTMAALDRVLEGEGCTRLSLGTSPGGNEVMGVRFEEGGGARIVALGTPQGPEYGERMGCAVAEFLASGAAEAVALRERFRVDVIPMPNPDDKRQKTKNFSTLFDFKGAAEGDPEAAWHARTLWDWLAEDPPALLLEYHSETRLKGAGCNRVYVVEEGVHRTPERGRLARAIAEEIDGLPHGGWLDIMKVEGTFEPILTYQAPLLWDTIAITCASHIRYGVEANARTSIQALLRMGDAYMESD